jgi:hypothetical protein
MTDEDDTHGGIFWVRADGGGLVSATPGEACDEIKRLRAENERLRAALEEIARDDFDRPSTPSIKVAMQKCARAALEVKP